jgi:hypothetical protein
LFSPVYNYKKKQFSNLINVFLDDINIKKTIKMTHMDALFRRFITAQSFIRGWGNPFHLQELCTSRREKVAIRSECLKLVPAESIHENTIEIVKQETKGDRQYIDAKFRSPLAIHFPHVVR